MVIGIERVVQQRKGKFVRVNYECILKQNGKIINDGYRDYMSLKKAAEGISKTTRLNVSQKDIVLNRVFINEFESVIIKEEIIYIG